MAGGADAIANIAIGYKVQQGMFILFSIISTVIFVAYLLSEKYLFKPCVSVKKLYHRTGLIMSLMMAFLSIDPNSVHGWLPYTIVDFVSINLTLIIIMCLCAALYYVINALHGLAMKPRPRHLKKLFGMWTVLSFVVLNAVYTALHVVDREWIRGLSYIWLGLCFLIIGVTSVYSISELRTKIADLIDTPQVMSQSNVGDRMRESLGRLLIFQIIVSLGIVAAEAAFCYNSVMKLSDMSKPVKTDVPDHYQVEQQVLLWAQWGAIFLIGWWSYIPMYVFCPPTMPEKREPLVRDRDRDRRRRRTRDNRLSRTRGPTASILTVAASESNNTLSREDGDDTATDNTATDNTLTSDTIAEHTHEDDSLSDPEITVDIVEDRNANPDFQSLYAEASPVTARASMSGAHDIPNNPLSPVTDHSVEFEPTPTRESYRPPSEEQVSSNRG
jgi:hypothetical protein